MIYKFHPRHNKYTSVIHDINDKSASAGHYIYTGLEIGKFASPNANHF